jgi:phosphoribosylaminoimidazolecarboxamide formyltransferase / IMP cyclohydrolase
MITIRRALLSVSDKTGLADLARCLHRHGCELISTGGTADALRRADLPVTDVAAVTGSPEAFGGRMKTISFALESAILFDRERDAEEAARLRVEPIDLVVCNLYPFAAYRAAGADRATLLEQIDVGGPTMIRAAAKNHRYVAVVTDILDYPALIDELDRQQGALDGTRRQVLMRKAFNCTADYDSDIAQTMDELAGEPSLRLAFEKGTALRYGENSHQQARWFRRRGAHTSLHDLEQVRGSALSYNNIVDIHSALDAVRGLPSHGCAVIKHTNPCGLAVASSNRRALEAAWAGDPVSAFGSVIALNAPADRAAVEFLALDHPDKAQRKFVEAVVAPEFAPDALALLAQHKTLRVVQCQPAAAADTPGIKIVGNAGLVQEADELLWTALTPATTARAPQIDRDLLEFGIVAVRQVRSNAIVIVRRLADRTLQLLGMGGGQPNRLVSIRLAIDKARDNLRAEYQGPAADLEAYAAAQMAAAVLVSDAFFPFPDNVDMLAAGGITLALQPGGSIRDGAVIERANQLGVAMIFTGVRHFRH